MKRAFLLCVFLSITCTGFAQKYPTIAPNPYKATLDRIRSAVDVPVTGWRGHVADSPHPEDPDLNDSGWSQVEVKQPWSIPAYWVRKTIEIPQQINGYDPKGSKLQLDFAITSNKEVNISVFSNGTMVARSDEETQLPITLTEKAEPGQKFVIAARVLGSGDKTQIWRARLLLTPPDSRPDPAIIADEIDSVYPLINAYADGKEQRDQQMDAAVKAIDTAALDKGDQAAFDASLRKSQQTLEQLRPYVKKFSIHASGNSHIDMAWLWPWTETVEVTRNTFGSVLQLMREYPQLTFTMATAQTYKWMEDKYPDMFKEIQERVKEGRWEIVGGMWVEPDLNLPDGESLARQLLYGKRYFQQKFGVDVKIGWNPDSFGYNWQLPQIYKRAGVDYFVTQKIYWNDTTDFRYKLFRWEAPDGSSLLTYFPHDYANDIEPAKMANDLSHYAPAMWKQDPASPGTPDGALNMMYLFGVGDHGGGPTRKDLDIGLRWQKKDVVYPEMHFDTAGNYFAELQKNEAELNIPTWDDELYLEYHRGVQTTQSEEKKHNRKSEVLILNAEKLAAIDALFGASYPKAQFERAWKNILFNQFHDILPGSGIHINYVDAARRYDESDNITRGIARNALEDIGANVKTTGTSLLVFNQLSWPRSAVVESEVQLPSSFTALRATDSAGKNVPLEVLDKNRATNQAHIRLHVSDVPPLGYETITLALVATAPSARSSLTARVDHLENEFLRVDIDPQTGCITSLFDKRSNTESLAPAVQSEGSPANLPNGKPCGNLLQTFVDKPKDWDAWNIDADFTKQHTDLTQADSVKLVENTPLKAVVRVEKHTANSKFVQDITMYPGVPRLDVKMNVDWNEKHVLLKVAFPVSVTADKATFEIPYGSIERPTTRRTPEEKAKFEVPALRWADLSDAKHGLSLLNDCKYGYDAKDNVLRLSLLRSPVWPDPHTDEGHHEFTYSLYPHGGTWKDAMTVRQGYELNDPLIATAMTAHAGPLPAEHSFVSTNANNVIISDVKQAEDDQGMIIRYYEWAGKAGDVGIHLPQAAKAAYDVNLMEKGEKQLALSANGTEVTIPTKPYEIRTVRVEFAK
ncbi:MAG TPA: alpha-mannosidase [Terriglobales bacterium]|nr:alpha-mannosidase [Terriglobales bacterium]